MDSRSSHSKSMVDGSSWCLTAVHTSDLYGYPPRSISNFFSHRRFFFSRKILTLRTLINSFDLNWEINSLICSLLLLLLDPWSLSHQYFFLMCGRESTQLLDVERKKMMRGGMEMERGRVLLIKNSFYATLETTLYIQTSSWYILGI